jgi:hypothetical protein
MRLETERDMIGRGVMRFVLWYAWLKIIMMGGLR